MDTLFISGLRVPTIIGVHAWEKQIKQMLIIDLELQCDLHRAGETDRLENTIDYWHLCQQVEIWLQEKSFQLIEAAAETIAKKICEEFGASNLLTSVTVTVAKPSVASHLAHVAVKITRDTHA